MLKMYAIEILFWAGVFIVFYAYLGYGIILGLIVYFKRKLRVAKMTPQDFQPPVSFVVCAFNEAEWIEQKIANSLEIDYPKSQIQYIFVTDGSSDDTPKIIENYPFPAGINWILLHQPERQGKIAAFKRAIQQITTPFVVSTDANTLLNKESVQMMVRHFAEPNVGAVAGEKRIHMDVKADASSAGEGIYWKYESILKQWDAELWTVVGAAGELFAFRTEAYEHVPDDTIVEDFYMTMRIAQKGYRVMYEPQAFAVESSSASVKEELKRKIRIAAGGLQAFVRLAALLNPFKYGVLTFQYVSHRALRWTLAPLLLPIILVLNLFLLNQGKPLYTYIIVIQAIFYAAALIGYLLEQRQMKVKAFFIPYYFCMMNYAMFAGLFRLLRGNQSVLWERAKRSGESNNP